MGSLHMFSHHCESTVKTFGRLQTYYPPIWSGGDRDVWGIS
jgi:hypothetical protein